MAGGEILDNKTQITVGGRVSPVNGQYYSGITVELIQIKDNTEYVCGSGVTDSNGYYTITARVFNINGMGKLFTHVGNDCSIIIDVDKNLEFTVNDSFETYSNAPFTTDTILVVDYGDGSSFDAYSTGKLSHTYASSGNYHVSIFGEITQLNEYCFRECSSLTSITIPNSVTTFGDMCFANCTGLTSITIPDTVTTLGDGCFVYCTSLTSIQLNWDSANSIVAYNSSWIGSCSSFDHFLIPQGTTSLYVAKGYPSNLLREEGQGFDGISVSSTQDVLSYADGDSTVLSAQLTNQGQAVSVSGESVTFEVRKVSDDSLVETLTDTTDSNGEASVEYFGKGVGDLSIKCQCRSVIETYEITDALKYFDTTFTSSQTLTVPNLPTNFKCKFKVKGTTGSVTGSACWVEIGSNSNNLILFGRTSGASNTGIFVKVNGNYVVSQQGNSKYQSNDVQYIYEYDNGSQSVNDGSQTVTTTNSQITSRNYVNLNIGTSMYLKEILFLPL